MSYRVPSLLCLAAVIVYVQRSALSVPMKTVESELGFGPTEMSWVLSGWYWGYAAFQLPAGWLADRWGSRRAVVLLAVVWSALTGAAGLAWNFPSLLGLWAGMGCAQAGVFPCATKAIGAWFPDTGRAAASGWLVACQTLGFAVAPPLTAWLLLSFTWRTTFALYVIPGLAWAAAYWFLTPTRVEPRPARIPLAELVAGIVGSRLMFLLCFQQFLKSAAMVFFFVLFPRFLQETRGVGQTESGYLAFWPGIAAMFGSLSGGIASDWLLRRTGSRRLSRQGIAVAGMSGCAAFACAAYFFTDPYTAVLLISIGAFCGTFGGVSGYTVAIDFGGRRVATVFATMNMCGNVGSALFPLAAGGLVAANGDWNRVLLLFAFTFLACAACWAVFNPRGTLFPEDEA
jgi:MFS family permease